MDARPGSSAERDVTPAIPNPRQDSQPADAAQDSLNPDPAILERNLRMLAHRSAAATRAIRDAAPARGISFVRSEDGALTARMESLGGRLLASARAARVEATRFAQSVDIKAHAAVVVRGFGLGHHVRALGERLGASGVLICFEPDVSLLREVLLRIDCTGWMRATRFVLVTQPDNAGALSAGIEGLEGLLAAGVELADHPPSKSRLAGSGEVFAQTLMQVVRSVRTNVVTTLAHSELTLRNQLSNIDAYARAPGVADLANCQVGRPAVVVSAGPSLRRNVALLAEPGVRERVVIIAAQTVLKQLLALGVKPHFVTALDYHEISARFYEGLRREDVDGVTLVVEPKANSAIVRSYPGVVRCVQDDVLTRVLGQELARPMGALPPGATVAHLSYYLARFLGCDPVLLIGQDLGFTDGLYYSPGAAIHNVWANELNDATTLEMLEWQRIMRMRTHLRKTLDQRGAPIYTDEQMATYLMQFERDFSRDAQAGKTIIDATEGGVLKQHTRIMTLRQALTQLGVLPGEVDGASASLGVVAAPGSDVVLDGAMEQDAALDVATFELSLSGGFDQAEQRLMQTQPLQAFPDPKPSPVTRDALRTRLATLRAQTQRIVEACGVTRDELERMLRHHSDQALVNKLIARVQQRAGEVTGLEAHWLVQHINQTGQFNRFKADRALELEADLAPLERQKRQIERDIQNVTWLRDAGTTVRDMLDDACEVIEGKPPATRSLTPQDASLSEQTGVDGRRRRVVACMWVDLTRGVFGPRDLSSPMTLHGTRFASVLHATLARLGQMRELDGVLLVTPEPDAVRSLLGVAGDRFVSHVVSGKSLAIESLGEQQADQVRSRLRSVKAARLLSRHSWRTGLANVSVYDELLHPALWHSLLGSGHGRDVDAALLVGADWCAVDPALTDQVIVRYREAPRRHALCLSQASPGLCGAVVSIDMMGQVGSALGFASSLGHLVGYHPLTPQPDPIAKPFCVQVAPAVRDVPVRCTWEDANFRSALAALPDGSDRDAPTFARAVTQALLQRGQHGGGGGLLPETCELTLDASGWQRLGIIAQRLQRLIQATSGQGLALSVRDDAGEGPWREVTDLARRLGYAGVHVRTSHAALARVGSELLTDAMDLCVDCLSIDMPGDTPELWQRRAGSNTLQQCWDAMQAGLDARKARCGTSLPATWFVPRLMRSEATYADIESFYDRWLLTCGACIIDPPDAAQASERIAALVPPDWVRARRAWSHVTLQSEAVRMAGGSGVRSLPGGALAFALEHAI